jgi:hypothetical protein
VSEILPCTFYGNTSSMVGIDTWRARIAGQGLGPGKGIQLGSPFSFHFVQSPGCQEFIVIKLALTEEINDSPGWLSAHPEKHCLSAPQDNFEALLPSVGTRTERALEGSLVEVEAFSGGGGGGASVIGGASSVAETKKFRRASSASVTSISDGSPPPTAGEAAPMPMLDAAGCAVACMHAEAALLDVNRQIESAQATGDANATLAAMRALAALLTKLGKPPLSTALSSTIVDGFTDAALMLWHFAAPLLQQADDLASRQSSAVRSPRLQPTTLQPTTLQPTTLQPISLQPTALPSTLEVMCLQRRRPAALCLPHLVACASLAASPCVPLSPTAASPHGRHLRTDPHACRRSPPPVERPA